MRERVSIANYTMVRQVLSATLLLDVDGADIFEIRGYGREERGTLAPIEIRDAGLVFGYEGRDGLELRTTVTFEPVPDSIEPAPADRDATAAACWELEIEPGAAVSLHWEVQAAWRPGAGGAHGASVERLEPRRTSGAREDPPATRFESDDELVNLVLARGLADIRLLETGGPAPGESFIAAGVPWFATLFGRDAILASLFLLPVHAGLRPDDPRGPGPAAGHRA